MMICDSLLNHESGVTNLANRARALGASDAEINEALGVAYLMGGLPAMVPALTHSATSNEANRPAHAGGREHTTRWLDSNRGHRIRSVHAVPSRCRAPAPSSRAWSAASA